MFELSHTLLLTSYGGRSSCADFQHVGFDTVTFVIAVSLDVKSSLLLDEWVHALARRCLSPCTLEQHRLEHRRVHLDLLNHVLADRCALQSEV